MTDMFELEEFEEDEEFKEYEENLDAINKAFIRSLIKLIDNGASAADIKQFLEKCLED